MSAVAQTNGKKSSNSSTINTPAGTPVANGNPQTISQSTPPPPNNNAPKYGTLVPNRIFVGGISANTTEGELLQLFSNYGTVKAAKIIQDRAGVSKGYGFITFESEDDAKRPLKDADNIVLRERKLNIAPAIKKQPFNRAFDASSPSNVAPGNAPPYFFPPNAGVSYFQGGVTYYQQPQAGPGDPTSQPTTVYQAPPVYPAQTGPPQAPTYSPMMFPHHITYMPQQYAMPPMPYTEYNYYAATNGGPYIGAPPPPPPNSAPNGHQMPPSISPPRPPPPPPQQQQQQQQQPPNQQQQQQQQQQPPPPPPPCYNAPTQMAPPPYAQEPIYYNMPMYGSAGADGLYGDLGDMACYQEVSPLFSEYFGGAFEDANPIYDQQELVIEEIDNRPLVLPPPPPQSQPQQQQQQFENDANEGEGRQTKTPVVSLLSMEQHQEKDLVAMQGGRRVKLQPPQQQYTPPQQFHYGFTQQPPRPPLTFNNNNNNNKITTTSNGWRKPTPPSTTTTTTTPSRTFIRSGENNSSRSNSNSSAHDDKVEERGLLPSAAILPGVQNYQFYQNGGTRTYQNSYTRRNFNNNVNVKKEPLPPPPTTPYDNNRNKSNYIQSAQVLQRSQQQAQQQSYVIGASSTMASRRGNKRTQRRSGGNAHAQVVSEIGAGDAPLPPPATDDACKKMEGLKI